LATLLSRAEMTSRWDRLLGQKPISLSEHLAQEAARHLATELRRWPLPVEALEPEASHEVVELLGPDSPRPPAEAFTAALQLARWDLERQHEAYDDYMRNRRYLEVGLVEADRPALLLVSRWVLEQLLALSEATGGRVDRKALVSIIERIRRHLASPDSAPD
jgi:hypothetical protein